MPRATCLLVRCWLTPSEVARHLRLPVPAVIRLITDGPLRGSRFGRRKLLRVRSEDLARYEAEGEAAYAAELHAFLRGVA